MQITGDYQLVASPEDIWRAIHDDLVLQRCIPGCKSIERLSDDQLRAIVTTKVGPVSATLKGLITFSEQNPPESLYLTGSGDGGIVGFAKGGARVALKAVPDGTHLTYEIDVSIGGKLAQLGQRLLAGTAKKNSDIFFNNLVAYFNEKSATTEPLST